MEQSLFHGIVPMQVTPFRHDGSLDLDGLAAAIEWQAGLGITSLSALGMAGEFFKLATDEIEAVISAVVDASGDVYTLVGVSAGSGEIAARLARHAASAGADGLLVLPPFGIKPSADGLIDYFRTIAGACDLPITVQDGSDELRAVVPFDVLVRLCHEVSAIRSIKVEDITPGPKISALGEALGDRVVLLCGSAGLDVLECYDRGAIGCISGAATSDLLVELDGLYHSDRDAAELRYRELLPLIQFQAQSTELFVATEKRLLARRVPIDPRVRTPGYVLDARQLEILDSVYRAATESRLGA